MAAIRGVSLKQVAKIRVSFCPYDNRTSTAREFLRRVSSRNMRQSNNKCQIISEVKNDASAPVVEITFADKETMTLNTGTLKLMSILAMFNKKCREKESKQ